MNIHDRYAAAEGLLSAVAMPKIRNAAPTVRWMKDNRECWYQRETADGHEWLVVEPARNPAVLPSAEPKAPSGGARA